VRLKVVVEAFCALVVPSLAPVGDLLAADRPVVLFSLRPREKEVCRL
jgi:hypothetical protein